MFRGSFNSKQISAGPQPRGRAHIVLVAYDVHDRRRRRRIFRLLSEHGEWVQFSLFQCLLTTQKKTSLQRTLENLLMEGEDHIMLIDVGTSVPAAAAITSLGRTFVQIAPKWTVV